MTKGLLLSAVISRLDGEPMTYSDGCDVLMVLGGQKLEDAGYKMEAVITACDHSGPMREEVDHD